MLESFFCFCLSTSRKGISGCATGKGERVYEELWKRGLAPSVPKSLFLQFQHGSASLAATVWALHTQACSRHCSSPSLHAFLTAQSTPGLPQHLRGDHPGCRQLQGVSRLPFLCPARLGDSPLWSAGQTIPAGVNFGAGSSKSRCFSGWSRWERLQPADGRRKHSQDRGNCDIPDENGDFFQPTCTDLKLIPQVELSFPREQPQPSGEGRKFIFFCILLVEGGAGQVSALGIQSPWQYRGRGWPSFLLQGWVRAGMNKSCISRNAISSGKLKNAELYFQRQLRGYLCTEMLLIS